MVKMGILQQQIQETTDFLKQAVGSPPVAGIVLGTGLGALVQKLEISRSISYTDIPHFPLATAESHQGNLYEGTIAGRPVLLMSGRFHYYEGYTMQQITFPVRVMHKLGIRYLFLTNAAGGINLSYKKGDLVITEDHINLLPDNPLRGVNEPALGNRFADMSCPYDKTLRQLLRESFLRQGIAVKEGVYAAVMGPSLETRAEYRWLRNTGADMVGMSTVPEIIVAAQLGIPSAAVSVITDECDPDNLMPVNIPEILAIAGKADMQLSAILEDVTGRLA